MRKPGPEEACGKTRDYGPVFIESIPQPQRLKPTSILIVLSARLKSRPFKTESPIESFRSL
jgi:hypothetical protein